MKPTNNHADGGNKCDPAKLLQERARIVARLRQLDSRQIASYIQPVDRSIFPGPRNFKG